MWQIIASPGLGFPSIIDSWHDLKLHQATWAPFSKGAISFSQD